eukprot:5102787-Amphidinium_carterae.1
MPFHIWRNLRPNVQEWQRKHSRRPQRLKNLFLDYRKDLHYNRDFANNDAGFSSNEAQLCIDDPMTGPLQDTALKKAKTTPGYRMDSLSLMRSGGVDATAPLIWPQTYTTNYAHVQWLRVTSVTALG